MLQVEKAVLLQTLDHLWREHIVTVEHLRQVIHLRGYGQRDPLNEYKTEGFNLFEAMIARLREMATAQVMRVEIQCRPPDELLPDEDELPPMEAHHIDATTGEDDVGEGFDLRPGNGNGRRRMDPSGRRHGARSAATIPALAAQARSTSTATGPTLNSAKPRWYTDGAHHAGVHVIEMMAVERPVAGIVGIKRDGHRVDGGTRTVSRIAPERHVVDRHHLEMMSVQMHGMRHVGLVVHHDGMRSPSRTVKSVS